MPGAAGVSDAEISIWSRDATARLRIAARLAREIRDGKYSDWRPLPTGSDLAGEYDVSCSTANRAQQLLARRGLIRREGSSYFAVPSAPDG
jgi:DNA-binding GntR family transcriptional regulator